MPVNPLTEEQISRADGHKRELSTHHYKEPQDPNRDAVCPFRVFKTQS